MYCEIHKIAHETDSCPVCYLMKFLANDQKRNFYEKFPVAQPRVQADGANGAIKNVGHCPECGQELQD